MSLDELRLKAAKGVTIGIVAFAALIVGCEFFLQGGFGLATMVALPCVAILLGLFAFMRNSQGFRYAVVSVLMAEVMALVIAARGNPWQPDMHMAFFAALAVGALMYDVRAIILGSILVAIHHLGLGLTVDSLVFYGGGGIERVLLHVVILFAQTAALVVMTLTAQRLLAVASQKGEEATHEANRARAMAEVSEAERSERAEARSKIFQRLDQSFGKVVTAAAAGEFSARVDVDFDDEVLNNMARNLNGMIETIDRGVTETGSVLASMARTDLTKRVEGHYEGAFLRLKTDTNAVAERLSEIVVNLRDTSKSLKVATGEIAGGANDLSARTAKQAGTIQETAAVMSKLSSAVMTNAERASDASVNAANVTQTAEEGGNVMHQATEAMERITASSAKISNIIGLIDDIAFQTNLLALNASVEAARAGEAGKGFAVVAVEVRRLAQSAAEASKEIKVLIDQSAGEVKTGSGLVEQAANRLAAMLEAARANNQLLDSIARDSREQAGTIEEVNGSVRQLDEMTQHNASLVEETNAAIAQTDGQAGELDRIVGIFTVAGQQGSNAPAARAPKAESAQPKAAAAKPAGIKAIQQRVQSAAKTYLGKSSGGNAAVAEDWSEF